MRSDWQVERSLRWHCQRHRGDGIVCGSNPGSECPVGGRVLRLVFTRSAKALNALTSAASSAVTLVCNSWNKPTTRRDHGCQECLLHAQHLVRLKTTRHGTP